MASEHTHLYRDTYGTTMSTFCPHLQQISSWREQGLQRMWYASFTVFWEHLTLREDHMKKRVSSHSSRVDHDFTEVIQILFDIKVMCVMIQCSHHFLGCVSDLYLLYLTFHSRTPLQCRHRPSWIFEFATYNEDIHTKQNKVTVIMITL